MKIINKNTRKFKLDFFIIHHFCFFNIYLYFINYNIKITQLIILEQII